MKKYTWIKKRTDRFQTACLNNPIILVLIDTLYKIEIPIWLGEGEIQEKIRFLELNDKITCQVKNLDWKFDYLDHKINSKW